MREKTWTREAVKALNYFLRNREEYLRQLSSEERFHLKGELLLSTVELGAEETLQVLWGVPYGEYYIVCCTRPSGRLLHIICSYHPGCLKPLFEAEEWLEYQFP